MRIVLFIGSPIEAEKAELTTVGKKLRKCNVAVDVVSFGDIDENAEKLEAFMSAVNKNNNSNLVTVPPGANLADVLLSTPIFMDEDSGAGGSGFAAAAAAASSHAAMQGFDVGDAMMNGEDDPALMLALRVSLEEERARQEAAAAAAEGGTQEGGTAEGTSTPSTAAATTPAATLGGTSTPAGAIESAAAGDDPMMMDEDALLQRAFALSMGGDGSVPTTGGDDDDPALLAALQMSMQEDQVGSGMGSGDVLTDASYVNSILSSLPGVDPNDPTIQAALNATEEDEKEEDAREGE